MIRAINKPFRSLNRKKILGSRPFKKIIPKELIPEINIKCISKPDFYQDLGYKDPKQCPKSKKKKKKKKKGFMDSIGSASTNIFFILVILLFILMYVGFQHGDPLKLKDTPKPPPLTLPKATITPPLTPPKATITPPLTTI